MYIYMYGAFDIRTLYTKMYMYRYIYGASNFLFSLAQLWYGEPKILVLNPVLDFFSMKLTI
jgi:hypothetical protein